MQSLALPLPITLLHLTSKRSLILALILMDKVDHWLDQQDNILIAVLLLKEYNIQALALQNLSNFQKINMHYCKSLEVLLNSIEHLRNLREINLTPCESLKVLPILAH